MPYVISFLVSFFAAAALTAGLRALALQTGMLDHPVARSAHAQSTPLAGGLSIAGVFLVGSLFNYFNGSLPANELMALLAGALLAAIGLVDDLRQLNIRWRVPAQFLAAIWVIAWLGEIPAISLAGLEIGGVVLLLLAILALVWLTNLYNFMDGIDGLAGSELVFVNVMSFIFVINSEDQVLALASLSLFAAGLGFLLWNWPPAKIFMGDAGSGFVGFILGVLAIISMQHGSLTVWTWLLLLGVFVVDATVTLLRRVISGQKWYEGHASHAYQQAARKYQSHRKVTITVIAINCLWLAPLAWLSTKLPENGIYFSLLGIIPLVFLAWGMGAGEPVRTSDVTDPGQGA
ncbi:MAG: glycosyltransferase family 4 protein [Gammaproteobacteria bacterium]